MWEFRLATIENVGAVETSTTLDFDTDITQWFALSASAAPVAVDYTAGPREGALPIRQQVDNVTETFEIWTPTTAPVAAINELTLSFMISASLPSSPAQMSGLPMLRSRITVFDGLNSMPTGDGQSVDSRVSHSVIRVAFGTGSKPQA